MMRSGFVRFVVAAMVVTTRAAQEQRAAEKGRHVVLKYLGTAGWEITDGATTILIDPYMSRINWTTISGKVTPFLEVPAARIAGATSRRRAQGQLVRGFSEQILPAKSGFRQLARAAPAAGVRSAAWPFQKASCCAPSKGLIPGAEKGSLSCARSKWFWHISGSVARILPSVGILIHGTHNASFQVVRWRVILCGMRTSRLVLLIIGVVAVVALWWFSPPYLVDFDIIRHGTLDQIAAIEPDKYALLVDEYRKTLSQAIGGLGFVGALWISVLTLRANERAKLTERFGRALDHLGAVRSEDAKVASEVRIGAVSELEGIGDESPRELRMIRSSFVAYLRNYALWRSALENKYSPAMWRLKETQAMMSVLGRWGFPAETRDEIPLADIDLRHLHLLPQAKLANLIAARSHFDYATLKEARFRNADLTRTVFSGAKLEGADFRGANLSECDFVGSNVWGWKYDENRFGWGGFSSDANLLSADMRGVDLSSTRMTEKQFKSIITDAETKPPQSFR
jgi:hypothetical protein